MTKICHISTVHQAFDGRIFHKQCVSLSNAGFDVCLIVTHNKTETIKGVKIIGLPQSNNRLTRILIKPWLAFFKALATKSKIFHFHDPELMFVGVMLSLLGKKVIFDSHENVSNQIESKAWLGNLFFRKVIKNIYIFIEKFCILFFKKVVSVTPEIVSFLSTKKGVLIRNYPIISLINGNESTGFRSNPDKLTFIYVGGLTKIRGIYEISKAINEMANENVELILLGSWESETYKAKCLINDDVIKYLGSKPLSEVYPIMRTADVGFVILYPEKNYLNSLPIKAFEYMACGLPMIMSNFPYWVNEFDSCSKFVDPNSSDEIKASINWMINNLEDRLKMGVIGKKAVNERYSWEMESKTLISMYYELSDKT